MSKIDSELERFIDAHYGRLVGLLRFRGLDSAESQDVAQESMVRLVEHWDRVRSMDNGWAWLATVGLNLSYSRWRRWQTAVKRRHLLIENVHYDSAAVEALQLLEPLTERQRCAVALRYFAGFSVKETAQMMNVAEGTIKSLCASGLASARTSAGELVEQRVGNV